MLSKKKKKKKKKKKDSSHYEKVLNSVSFTNPVTVG